MIRIRKNRKEDARAVSGLISRTYLRFNHREGTAGAVRKYVEMFDPMGKKTQEIHRRLSRTPICFVAVDGLRVVGVVRGIENRVINLFVDGEFHRRGIATRLVEKFEHVCRLAGHKTIVLRSSLFATGFYESLGYRKTTGVRNFHGLGVQPMRKKLK